MTGILNNKKCSNKATQQGRTELQNLWADLVSEGGRGGGGGFADERESGKEGNWRQQMAMVQP